MQAIILEKTGDPSHFKIQKVEDPKPKKNEVVIKHNAVGVNFLTFVFAKDNTNFLLFQQF